MGEYSGHADPHAGPALRQLSQLTVAKMSVGPMDNNCYLLVCHRTGQAAVIDAAADADRIIALISEWPTELQVRSIITTHRHPDHWQALGEVAAHTAATLYAGAEDVAGIPIPIDVPLAHGDTVAVGDSELEVISLRGHTPGSIALLHRDSDGGAHLFTGDSLFPGGPGKTSAAQDFNSLMDDLESRVFAVLPDDTCVYPGHGDDTTLGAERPHCAEWRARGW